MNWVKDMQTMHQKFGVNPVVRGFDKEKARAFLEFRIRFLQEELDEMQKALNDFDAGVIDGAKAADDIVDAAIDLAVVAIGTLDAYDVDAYTAWDRVYEKNMDKEVGVKASRPNKLGLPDLIKPTMATHGRDWTPPSHADNIGLLKRIF
jgi:predicted HAD superfamily Cof-like phosphohydrolase